MKSGRSTHPSVLVVYDPNFEYPDEMLRSSSQDTKCTTKKEHTGKKEKTEHHNIQPKSKNSSAAKSHAQRSKKRRDEDERLQKVTQRWEQVKAEYYQERHEILEQKVRLQQKLIRAQDIQAREQKEQQEKEEIEKRTEERKLKQEKAAALQIRSRSSVVPRNKAILSHEESPSDFSESETGSEAPNFTSAMDSSGHRREKMCHAAAHHSAYLPSDTYNPATSPMKELEDEEMEENTRHRAPDGVVTPADLNTVPWHHAQLYKMYGRNADYYIHPKVQPEKKRVVNPTVENEKVRKMGHMGASHIWTTLRNASMSKLHNTDRRFPQELKDTFGSHVREGITNHKKPVFRNFTLTEDVPDLNRIMDQTLLRRIRVLRHKTELMYRSSKTNNDRTRVLLFNSPLPAVSEGDEGIDKYLPSWDNRNTAESQMSYVRWLKSTGAPECEESTLPLEDGSNSAGLMGLGQNEHHRVHPHSVLSPLTSEFSDSLHSIWDSVMAKQKPRDQPRYHFLTEEEARTPGAFLQKLGLNNDKMDQGRVDLLPQLQNQSCRTSPPCMSAPSSRVGRHSISEPSSIELDLTLYESRWQPLSLNALVEYKEQMVGQGEGDFQQGRPTMWKT